MRFFEHFKGFNFKKRAMPVHIKAQNIAIKLQRSENATALDSGVISLRLFYNALGQLLYKVGYHTEYFFICLKREIKDLFLLSKFILIKFSKILWKNIKKYTFIFLTDFAEPWQHVKRGFMRVKEEIDEEYEKAEYRKIARKGMRYALACIYALFHILRPLAGYVLPVAACFAFIYVVNSMNGLTYALNVELEGTNLGIAQDENVFEEAQMLVRERIRTVRESDEWNAAPTFTLTVANNKQVLNALQLADAMVTASGDKIQQATGIVVDGELLGVTTEGSMLQQTLDELKAPYVDVANPNLTVEFIKDVKLIEGVYFTTSITEVQPIIDTLKGQVSGRKIYYVEKGDSPSGIASKLGMPLKDLYSLNPQIDPNVTSRVKMQIGDELLISNAVEFLQVKTVERVTRQIAIQHETIKTNSQDLAWGSQRVTVSGADGLEERIVDVTRIGGIIINEEIIESKILQEPVTEEITIGVKLASGGIAGDASTGNMIWPVPSSYSMSRGWSRGHFALDITAPRGTPIVAADNGIVTFAGKGAGSFWSYGNYVSIQHSTGITTLYAHMNAVATSSGTYVTKGQVIGYVGSTGRSTGNHCHFETIAGGSRLDPFKYVKRG